jgi:signal transduction histidine kinase
MMNSDHQAGEIERVSELHRYSVLDTPPEAAFDDLAKLAAYVCGTPISLLSLVDMGRIWFKSKVGIEAAEIPRIDGLCSSAILGKSVMVIADASANEQLASHPLVTFEPKLRFYAGAPLITPNGHCIGTLCVIDTVPRQITAGQIEALENLARSVVTQLELRRLLKNYAQAQQSLVDLQARTETQVKQRTQQLAETNESLQGLAGQLMNAQDSERRRIARELHDSTGQVLVALNMTLRQMRKNATPENLLRLDECGDLVTSAADDLRNLSYLLHPPFIEELGLASAVAEYAEGFGKRSGLRIQVEVSQQLGRLERNCELALFRIIQESLGNIHRHSGSSTARIKIFHSDEKNVVLEIRDQGRGLTSDKLTFGVGIRSMQERLRQFGGTLQIESSSHGTNVRAVLPWQSSAALALEQTA